MASDLTEDDFRRAMALLEPSETIGEFHLLYGWPLKPIPGLT